jgi:hypothetical protein
MRLRTGILPPVVLLGALLLDAGPGVGARPPATHCARDGSHPAAAAPVPFWSTQARCAMVPVGPTGTFGSDLGARSPAEAAVFIGIALRSSDLHFPSLRRTAAATAAAHEVRPRERVPPTCTADERGRPTLVLRAGYTLACGPGSAIVTVNGITYRIRHSACFGHGRLHFGAARWSRYSPRPAPRNSLMLVVESHDRPGEAPVIDGELELVAGVHDTQGALSGTAHLDSGLNRGRFTVFGRSGTASGRRFTGRWDCA